MSTLMLISATTVVTGGLGFIVGASLRGSVVAGLRDEAAWYEETLDRRNDTIRQNKDTLDALDAKVAAQNIQIGCLEQGALAHAAELVAVRRERDEAQAELATTVKRGAGGKFESRKVAA